MVYKGEPIRICWLKDARPGHHTKVRGLLKAIRTQREVILTECAVNWRPRWLRTCLKYLPFLKGLLPLSVCLPEDVIAGQYDLVISAGGATEWANASLAARCGAQNIYFGTLRACKWEAFTLLPQQKVGAGANYWPLDVVPSELDAEMAKAAADAVIENSDLPIWAVLIGGNGSGVVWKPEDWTLLALELTLRAKEAGVRLVVTTSRRTSVKGERILRTALHASGVLFRGVWSHEPEDGESWRIPAILGKAEKVIVTEDSSSMVNEAVGSGRPVMTVRPPETKVNALDEGILADLAAKGYIFRADGFSLGAMPTEASAWTVMPADWHTDVGVRLMERLKSPSAID